MPKAPKGSRRPAGAAARQAKPSAVPRVGTAPLVGRDAELLALAERLRPGRVLCLIGPPGVGKTHLLRALVENRSAALLVDLAAATSEYAVRRGVLMALGADAGEAVGAGREDSVGIALRTQRPEVLVLDGADDALVALESVLPAWRRLAPDTSFVVGCRTRTRMLGEDALALGPLVASSSQKDARKNPALRLFIERVREGRQGRAVQGDELLVAARLVSFLDGLPLAIEMFAALARTWSIGDLLGQLERGARSPTLDRRLRSALDACFAVLDDDQSHDLSIAILFRGTFSAAAFAAASGLSEASALARLDRLIDASWVVRDASTRSATTRLRVLRSTADFLGARLTPASPEAARRFVQWFAASAGTGTEAPDFDNLERALELAEQLQDDASSLALATELARASSAQYPTWEVARKLESMLTRSAIAPVARSLRLAAFIALAELERCLRAFEESIATCKLARRELSAEVDPSLEVGILARQLRACGMGGLVGDSPALIARLRELALTPGRPDVTGAARQAEGWFHNNMLDFESAVEPLQSAYEAYKRAGDSVAATESLALGCFVALERGSLTGVVARLPSVADLLLSAGRVRMGLLTLCYLAYAQLEQALDDGEGFQVPTRTLLRIEDAAQAHGRPCAWVESYLAPMGLVLHAQGKLTDAIREYERAAEYPQPEQCLFFARVGAAYADMDDVAASEGAFERALALLPAHRPPALLATIEVHRGHLSLAYARSKREGAQREFAKAMALTVPRPNAMSDERIACKLLLRAVRRAAAPGGPVFDAARREVRLGDGRKVDLSKRPVAINLLECLFSRGTASKEALVRSVWGRRVYDPSRDDARLQMAVTRLRRLLDDDGPRPRWIVTVEAGYGLGEGWVRA